MNTAAEADKIAREWIQELLDAGMSTVDIEKRHGFNRGLIPYVLDGNHSPTVLHALGIPFTEKKPVEVCPECGEIHTMHKMCGEDKRVQVRYRKSADVESRKQQRALDAVAYENGFDSWTELCRFMARKKVKGHTVIVDSD